MVGDNRANFFNDQILSSTEIAVKLALKLAKLCKIYKFDGWLLDVQTNIKKSNMPLLKVFVDAVTKFTHCEVPGSRVIWYDTVTESGNLAYQNELNVRN